MLALRQPAKRRLKKNFKNRDLQDFGHASEMNVWGNIVFSTEGVVRV